MLCHPGGLSLSDDGATSYLQHHAAPVTGKKEVTAPGQIGNATYKSKVAVCIAGQIGRLELDSKVRNVFLPLMEQQSLLHVFVALEAGDANYVNTKTASQAEVRYTPEDIRRKLHQFYQGGSIRPHVDHDMDIRPWGKYYLSRKSWVNRSERLASHMSQHANLKACVDLIEDSEAKLGIRYDVILKLRDNTIAPKPFKIVSARDIDAASLTEAVLVKNCADWGGINDKVMLIPRRHLRAALVGPYTVLKGMQNQDPNTKLLFSWLQSPEKLQSPEQLYRKVLEVYNVPILKVSPDVLPLLDARCQSYTSPEKSSWCPVHEHKDCWPGQPWNFPVPADCVESKSTSMPQRDVPWHCNGAPVCRVLKKTYKGTLAILHMMR